MSSLYADIVDGAKHLSVRLSTFPNALETAIGFRIDADVFTAAQQIAESPSAKLLDARRFVRFPFRKCWFEWSHASTFRDKPRQGNVSGAVENVPDKMGVLVETDESLQRGTMSWAWSGVGEISVHPLSVTFDFSGSERPVGCINRSLAYVRGVSFRHLMIKQRAALAIDHKLNDKQLTEEQYLAARAQMGMIFSPYTKEYMRLILAKSGADNFHKCMTMWTKDLQGEPDFVAGLVLCLNSKNLTAIGHRPDVEKLNAQRQRAGKRPMISFAEVRIRMDRISNGGSNTNASAAAIRRHIVRGRPKVRKTGVFWWSPYQRGNVEHGAVVRTGFRVSGGASP